MNKYFIYLIIFFICINISFSQPPFDVQDSATSGLQLAVPHYSYYPLGENLELFVHVFNTTTGTILYNDTKNEVDCKNEVFFPNGTILAEQRGTWGEDHLKLTLTKNNITKKGIYSFIVYCNTTYQGDHLTGFFEMTEDGSPSPNILTFSNGELFLFIIFAVQILIIVLFFIIGLPHKVGFLKISSWGLAFIEGIMTIWFVYIHNLGGDLSPFIYINAIASLIIGMPFGIYTLIILMIKLSNPAEQDSVKDDSYTKWMYDNKFNKKIG